MADRPVWERKVMPVVLPGRSVDEIPLFLQPYAASRFPVTELTVAGAESLLRVLTGQPLDETPPVGPVPVLGRRTAAADGGFSLVGVRQAVSVRVDVSAAGLSTVVELAGAVLGERTAPVPPRLDGVWDELGSDPQAAEARLAEAGRRLWEAMFEPDAGRELVRLIDHSAWGTVVDVEVVCGEGALWLPLELLRLPDGRALVTCPTVRVSRRIEGIDRAATGSLAGPLKVLAAVAAPEQTSTPSPPLDVEAEMQAILEALTPLERRRDAQVKILEVGGLGQVRAALAADQYHVLHLSAHGTASTVELEDEDGNAHLVPAEELVAALKSAGRPLPLIVLSTCSGAGAGLHGLAARLVREGADRVVAMQAAVSDRYATDLAGVFYQVLAGDPDSGVGAALARARREVEERRLTAITAGQPAGRPEYGVPTLIAAAGDPPLRTSSLPPQPLSQPTLPPGGRSVRELPVGYLIGRRAPLRTGLGVLRGTRKAVDAYGAAGGVVLTGIGGIGKTAVAGRIVHRLREDGWLSVVHDGVWSPPQLFSGVAEALQATDAPQYAQALNDVEVDDTAKLGLVGRMLAQTKLLLLFDDFEQNLTSGGEEWIDPGFADTFTWLAQVAQTGKLLVTCRYPLPGEPDLVGVDLPPLSPAELRRMLLRMPQLRDLNVEDRATIIATIGGHPRLIEFVDALLRHGRGSLREVTAKLRHLAAVEGIDRNAPTVPDAVDRAVLLGSRDIVLTELLDLLTDQQREVLLQASVSTISLSLDDLAVAVHGEEPDAAQHQRVAADVQRLLALTLLSPAPKQQVTVHAWVADALQPYHGDGLTERHDRAFTMRYERIRSGRWQFEDLTEACRHLAANRRYDDLTSLALAAADSGIGMLATAALLGQVAPTVPTGHPNYLAIVDREAQALLNTGNIDAAITRYRSALQLVEERVQADPGNAQAQRDLGISYERLGDLSQAVGDTEQAERFYRDSLAIRERFAQADPGNAEAQRDLGISYERLGLLSQAVGDTEQAERFYRDSLAIRERFAQADPGNAEAQRDLGISYERLGDLSQAVGDTEQAERFYRDGLAIRERLAQADPGNAQAQRDLSISYERLGNLSQAVGDTKQAERFHRDSLAIAQRLAQADPGNAEAQRDLSIAYNKLGDLSRAVGDTEQAERFYRDSLAIRERLAQADPGNAEAQRDLGISYERLGNLSQAVGDTKQAERFHRDSLAIRERLAQADPGNAEAQRDLSVSYNKLGDLSQAVGDTEQAERFYRDDLAIAQRLAQADPGNAQAQRDLSVSYNKLGDLSQAVGDTEQAEQFYRDSLAIAQRLAQADPGNAQAQRDLSISYNNLGDLSQAVGDTEQAERFHRDSLAIAQRLAQADPGNAEAQRDLSILRQRLETPTT
ncbi:tetratricopeptide repeat protein [Phytohabitans rumicis]